MASENTTSVVRDLRSASIVPADGLTDDLEVLARSSKYGTAILKLTLAKIKAYLSGAKVLVPPGGTTTQVLQKIDNADFNFHWADVAAGGATTLDGLTDVDTSTVAPADGQVLKFDSASGLWKPEPDAVGSPGVTTLDGLTDVDTSTVAPADGQVLKFDSASGLWKPEADAVGSPGVTTLDGLTDVDTSTTAPTNGQVLKFDSASGLWKPQADAVGTSGATNLDGLTDVDTSTVAPTDGQVLKFDAASGLWKPQPDATGSGSGSITLLQSQTVAGVANVVFDNTLITDTYKIYMIRWRNATQAVAGQLGLQLSPDNGVTWRASNYATAYENWGVTTSFSQYVQNGASVYMLLDNGISTDATIPSNGLVEIYSLRSATTKKQSRAESIGKKSDGNVYDSKAGSYYSVAELINAIRVIGQSGTISGTFELYGIS